MPRFKAVVAIASGRVIYQGRNDLKAAMAWEPGTTIGYSDDDVRLAISRALDAADCQQFFVRPISKETLSGEVRKES